MQPEIEAKFLNVDHNTVRSKLRQIGAKRAQPMRLMKRKNYDFPDGRLEKVGGWVRLRDEGNKITLCYKQLNDRTFHGTHEVSVKVDNFEQTDIFLRNIGLIQTSYQETRRESWEHNRVQIELDEWPWIRPFLEIEGATDLAVQDTAKLLELPWDEAVHGSVEIAYQAEYAVSEAEIDHWAEILFSPVPGWLQLKRKPEAKK